MTPLRVGIVGSRFAAGFHADCYRRLDTAEVVAVAAIDEEAPLPYTRVCRTCGNEYEGRVCPHCEAVRRRLRGG